MKRIFFIILILLFVIPVTADTLIVNSGYDAYLTETDDAAWGVITRANGDTVTENLASTLRCGYATSRSTIPPNWSANTVCTLYFGTSSLPDTSTINSAFVSVRGASKTNTAGILQGFSIVDITPASNNKSVAGDYNATTNTKLATDISYASFSTTAYNNMTLNPTGLSKISKTQNTTFMFKSSNDVDNIEPNPVVVSSISAFTIGASLGVVPPVLTIDYTVSGGDTTPPDAISNLVSTQTCSSINYTWTNPTTTDFNHTYVMRYNTFYANYSNTTTFTNWTGLAESTAYSFNSSTVDFVGNMNKTHWQNLSASTTVCGAAPVASFTPIGETLGVAPLSVSFNDTSTNTPTNWSYARNNLTHSTWELFSTSIRNATVSFPSGNWSVNLSASNAYGSNISTQVTWANVTNPIPVAAFSVNATVGTNYGMHVAFTDLSTGSPTSWAWEFGDGGTSTQQNPTYIYDVSRLYNVSLKVTNGYGEYDWENKTDYINLQSDLPNVGAWSHFDGANGGTVFIDEIGSAISSSGATTSSTQIKFGNASLLTNTAGSYISTPNSTRNWFGNSAFTLEGWMYPTSTGAGNQLWQSKTNKFLSQGWGLYHGSASATSNDWRFFMGNSAVNSTDAFTIPLNTWTHVAIQRYTNGTVFIYLNGNYTTSKAMVGSYDTSNPYRIGRQGTGSVSNSFIGYTDEARGSNVVRWYANFTPPTEAYRNGQLNPDTNLFSTLRFKTDPINTARITNQTGGGVRNRTIQIQNVNAVSHIIGSMTFDQEHLLVKNIYLNKSVWTDATLVSSFINNQIGYVEFNVTRAGGFSPDTTRSSFLDAEMLYWNYTPTGVSSSSFFGYGVVINSTTGTSYPIHNFIETVLTYTDWDFYPDFTSDVTTGNVPLTVQFTDTTIGYPNRWDWDWGDGEHTNWTTQNPTHIYTTPGLYTVTLNGTIWQNTSVMNSTTKIAYINVTPSGYPPVASFTYTPHEGMEPLSVQFTDTSTNTPDQWGWFFTNVTQGNNTVIQFSTLKNPLKIFGFGNYTIKLNATNVYGSNVSTQVSWVNASVYVPPLMPPVAAFFADDTSICQNATVTFTDASTNIPNAWLWEFGDGNTSILQNPTNTYYSLGQFTVNLRATNDDGFDWENKTNYITVNACLPPTPTPTPAPYCSFVNMTNVSIAHNSTSWVLSSGATFWGMEIINESEGNVSYYTCGADTLVSGGGGTDSGGASIGAVFGIVGGLVGAILYIRKRRQEEEEGVS